MSVGGATDGSRKWWTLLAVCVAVFMLLLDITIVNVALPEIQRDLGSSFSDIQWVVDAYALALASLLLTAGSLADLLGRKRVFIVGIGLFTLASLLCGLSSSPLMLNLSRGLQGIGGAVMFATSLALIAQEFQGRDRGIALGVYGGTVGAAVAIGPLVGGVLTDTLGWEWIFFVNIPVSLGAIALAVTKIRESRDPAGGRIDWAGVITFSGALFLLVYALVEANEKGWTSTQIVAMLGGAGVLLVLFAFAEWMQERPMLDLSLLRRPAFAGASIAVFALSASLLAMFLYIVLYIQNVLGYSALETGVRFLPLSVASFVIAPLAGRLSARVPIRVLVGIGLAGVGVGLLLMAGVDRSSDWTALLPGFILAGLGIGLANPPLLSAAVGVVPPERSGMASGINTTFRQVGIATGIAGLGAIFQHRVETEAMTMLAGTPLGASGRAGEFAHRIASDGAGGGGSAPPGEREMLAEVARTSFESGLNEILVVGGLLALVGAVLAVALVRSRDFVSGQAAAARVA